MKWNLQRLKFLLGHIEDFIDSDWKEIRERAQNFAPQMGLEAVRDLIEPAPQVRQPLYVLDRLTPFFESGLMLKTEDDWNWQVTDVFWRGSVFHLENDEQSDATHLIADVSPLNVKRAPAVKILESLKMEFLAPGADSSGYLLKPTPSLGYVLFSNLADPFARDHVSHAHRLLNKAFVY